MHEVANILPVVLALAVMFGIPVVAILTHHQRKMAELIHGRHNASEDQRVAALLSELQQMRAEMGVLRDRVNAQAIASDDGLLDQVSPPPLENRR